MKKILIVCSLAMFVACAKEPSAPQGNAPAVVEGDPTSEIVQPGTVAVKLTPEAARQVEAAKAAVPKTRSGAATRSGLGGIDEALDRIGAESFERIVAYDPEWEAAYDDTGINRWYRVRFDERTALAEAGRLLASQEGVAIVEFTPDPKYRRPLCKGAARPFRDTDAAQIPATRAVGPGMNDPLLAQQWHYENGGPAGYSTYVDKPVAGADINLYDAWSLCKGGQDIVVAVIDEPVQTTHPDLAANIWSSPTNPNEHGYNFWNQKAELDWRSNEYNSEYREWEYADHGSHVAGVIAAVNNNGRGVCGIAGGDNGNGVKIMSCQIMGYDYNRVDYDADVKAFEYAWKNGAVIAQNSWGYADPLSDSQWNGYSYRSLRYAIDTFAKYAGTNNPNSPIKGGLVIFAAGNDGDIYGDRKMYPAAYSPVIAVASMDWRYLPAYYTDYGTWVDITAPGGDLIAGLQTNGYYADGSAVLSTILCDDAIDYQDGRKKDANYGYGFMQGTSMACPHVSGVAALGLAYASQLGKQYTAEEYTALLLSSVTGIDNRFSGTKRGDGLTMTLSAFRGKMGGGCIDALKLLLAIKGTPAVYVSSAGTSKVDLGRFFGGGNSPIVLSDVQIAAADMTKIGMTAKPTISGTSLEFRCSQPGTAMFTVTARVGDTSVTREFACVARAGLAQNGGWL